MLMLICNFMAIIDYKDFFLSFCLVIWKELAAGNVNIKNLEKVNSFPVFTKVGLNLSYI